jgi:GAF domain-containing protein
MTTQPDTWRSFESVVEDARLLVGAERAALVLAEDGEMLNYVASTGRGSERIRGARGPAAGSGLAGSVLQSQAPVLSANPLGDPRIKQSHVKNRSISTALGVPLLRSGSAFAVLMVVNREDGGTFTVSDEQRLTEFAAQVVDAVWMLRQAARSASGQDRN